MFSSLFLIWLAIDHIYTNMYASVNDHTKVAGAHFPGQITDADQICATLL